MAMADRTSIEWTDATWNVVNGCSVISPGCTNCYAMKLAGTRLRNIDSRKGLTVETKAGPVWTGEVRVNWGIIEQPLSWSRPRKIFANAHGDLFHVGVSIDTIAQIFGTAVAAHHLRGHIFQFLTKRADRQREILNSPLFWELVNATASAIVMERTDPLNRRSDHARATLRDYDADSPPPGIWLGTSVEDQKRADERIPHLIATPAAIRFLSCEPLLGPVDLTRVQRFPDTPKEFINAIAGRMWTDQNELPNPDPRWDYPGMRFSGGGRGIDWVIAGGESGPGARAMHPDWARSLRDQCAAAGVPFHFKQWGNWAPSEDGGRCIALDGMNMPNLEPNGSNGDGTVRITMVGKKTAGRLLDGVEHNGFPS